MSSGVFSRLDLIRYLEQIGWKQIPSTQENMIAMQKAEITWFLNCNFQPGDLFRMVEHEVINRKPQRAGC